MAAYYPDEIDGKVSICCGETLYFSTDMHGKRLLRCGACGSETTPVNYN